MKGIILAAGYGTRFLPATKTIPKEMFPLIDTPAIDFIINEMIQSGIKDILIVTSRRKKILDDYYDREIELETIFNREQALTKLKKIQAPDVNIYLTRQKEMLGTGHAILISKSFIGNDAFIVAYPDDLIFSSTPLSQQLIRIYQQENVSVLSGMLLEGDISRYGVIDYVAKQSSLVVQSIVEKPAPGREPSRMISIGRYLFTPQLLELLEKDYLQHKKGEFYHINSINQLAARGKVMVCQFEGKRIDIGDKLGYLEGILYYALSREDLKTEAQKIINHYAGSSGSG